MLVPLALGSLIVAILAPWPGDEPPSASIRRLCGGDDCPLVDDRSFRWVDDLSPGRDGSMEWHAAVFLARKNGRALRDLYVADFRVTSGGLLREMRRITNVSRSADADEGVVASDGEGRVAYAARYDGRYDSFSFLDFSGEPADLTEGWSRAWKMANGITNFQRTGRVEGVHWRSYLLKDPRDEISLAFDGASRQLVVGFDGGEARVEEDGTTTAAGVTVQEMVKGQPAPLAWAVDTVRDIPWVGRRKIEWLEKVWFDLNDWLARTRYDLVGDEEEPGVPRFPVDATSRGASPIPGWPPPNMDPMLKKPRANEGVWFPVDDEGYARKTGAIPLFYQTFFRSDPERPFARVHLAAWDPSAVELKMMAGVREPISTTGIRGEGEIPREKDGKDEIGRLVGAFNGAFQALHGEWGMTQDHKILLPPRAFGATVALWDDGRVSMGTWPHPVGEIPAGMRDLRQNVNPLVEGGKLNPYQRKWWGGVPEGVEERVITTRSGICLTTGGKLIYFWGDHLSPESLGDAMLAAGCDYGIHLDMNSGHCGFEYYRVDDSGALPALTEEGPASLFAEGTVPRRQDLRFRARKMVQEMGHMRFPRYVGRDPRDFFYLLVKKTIFDGPAPDSGGGTDGWKPVASTEGLPVPVVVASAGGSLKVHKVDTAQTVFTIEDEASDDAILSIPFASSLAGISTGLVVDGTEVWPLVEGGGGLLLKGGTAEAFTGARTGDPGDTVIQGVWRTMARQLPVRHAVGFDDEGYLMLASGGGMEELGDTLESVGAGDVFGLISPEGGEEAKVRWLVVRQRGAAGWFRMFTDVEPVAPEVWRKIYADRGKLLDRLQE